MRQETSLLFEAEEDPSGLLVSQPLEGMKSVFFHTGKLLILLAASSLWEIQGPSSPSLALSH